MRNAATQSTGEPGLSFRECLAAWAIAVALVMAMVASSVVALVFESWV